MSSFVRPARPQRTYSLRIPRKPYPMLSHMKNNSALPNLKSSGNSDGFIFEEDRFKPEVACNVSSRCSTKVYNGEPLVDTEFPQVISLSSNRHILKGEINIASLPPLPSPRETGFDQIFKEKIKICNYIFNFSQQQLQIKGKKQKSIALVEISNLLSEKNEASLLKNEHKDLILEMIMKNILEQDPFTSAEKIFASTVKSNFVERSWEHISLIYKVLNQFVLIFPSKCKIDLVKKGIRLMNIPDSNERENLVIFLKNYTKVHPDQFEEIWKQLESALINVRYDIYTSYCVEPIISYINYLYLSNIIKIHQSYFIQILYTHLLPLFRHERLSLYFNKLSSLINKIIENNFQDQLKVIQYLIKHFPYQCGQKQPIYVSALTSIIKTMKGQKLNPIASKLFIFIAMALKSPNSKLAESALTLLMKPNMKPIMFSNYELALENLYEPLKWSSSYYWEKTVKEQSQSALTTLLNMKLEIQKSNAMQDFILTLDSPDSQLNSDSKKHNNKELAKTWATFSRMAAKRYRSFDLTKSLLDIQIEFSREDKNKDYFSHQSERIIHNSDSNIFKSTPLRRSKDYSNGHSLSLNYV